MFLQTAQKLRSTIKCGNEATAQDANIHVWFVRVRKIVRALWKPVMAWKEIIRPTGRSVRKHPMLFTEGNTKRISVINQ